MHACRDSLPAEKDASPSAVFLLLAGIVAAGGPSPLGTTRTSCKSVIAAATTLPQSAWTRHDV